MGMIPHNQFKTAAWADARGVSPWTGFALLPTGKTPPVTAVGTAPPGEHRR